MTNKYILNSQPVFDAHLHIIDPRFPLIANKGYLPDNFSVEDYLQRLSDYPLKGGAVVSGSFQGFDQEYLLQALKELGEGFVGVTQLPFSTSDQQILQLAEHGVRAVRFNLFRGGSEDIKYLKQMAHRVYELAGWHIELYIDSRELAELTDLILSLPKVSIDHLGLSSEGFVNLLRLVDNGVHVKATGFSRGNLDVPAVLRQLYSINPHALMFGTDLPSTRAPRLYDEEDYHLLIESLGERAASEVLYDNAAAFYSPVLKY